MAGNTVKDMTTNFGKLDKFEGNDFRRWQKKMHFLLTMLKTMAEEDAFLVNNVEGGLCVDYTDARIVGRCNNGSDKNKGKDSLKSKYMAADSSSKKFIVDAIAWWIDSGATTHVCKDRCWFKTFEPVEDGSVLYMGDEHFA
nr:hypothetical protein [Tanacetum cinerariifolium]